MKQPIKLTIAAPCQEKWANMTPTEAGRHCLVCSKEIIDFTGYSEAQLKSYFQNRTETETCGRLYQKPSDILRIEIPDYIVSSRRLSWEQRFLLCLFIGFASTLFNYTNALGQVQKKAEVILIDSASKARPNHPVEQPKPSDTGTPMIGLVTYSPPENGTLAHPYRKCSVMPEYVGGAAALKSFIEKNLQYPSTEEQNKTAITVNVTCLIDSTGQIVGPYSNDAVSPALVKESLRLVWKMPKWKPGMQNGKNVNVEVIVPITFKVKSKN